MTHITPDWLASPEIKTLIAAFAKHEVPLRFVGGCVRDALLGKAAKDIDAATPLAPEHVMDLLKTENIKAIPTGIDHGTITAVINSRAIEITTLRRDIATDGRHAEVEYTENWEQDAARRDFTINAFYLSPEGELFDYHHGREDLEKGHVRFIGNAEHRIQEDYLRILRFFRFYAWYGKGVPDAEALTACAKHAAQIETLSGERIQQEMLKLLAAPMPLASFEAMQKASVLAQVLHNPEIENMAELLAFETEEKIIPDPPLRLAALLSSYTIKDIAALANRWKFSNALTKKLEILLKEKRHIQPAMTLAERKKLLRRAGTEIYRGIIALAAATSDASHAYRAMLALPYEWQPPEFPLTGDDLKQLGFTEGKYLGEMLKKLEEAWEASDYTLTKSQLLGKTKAL